MSNIAFLTTRRHVKSYDIVAMLVDINYRRFGGKLAIQAHLTTPPYWSVYTPNDMDGFDIYNPSPRKLSIKHPMMPWMDYVALVFRHELGRLTGAILSDEGVEETWLPDPDKYPTFQAWLELRHSRLYQNNPDSYLQLMQIEWKHVPSGMEKY
jgi:hypothetical protein